MRLLSAVVLTFLVNVAPVIAQSSPIVEIPFRRALGRSGPVARIDVYPRVGYTIINFREAFGETNEKIRQVTLGDSNPIDVTSDDPACISNLKLYSSGDTACSASLLYVKVDNDAVENLQQTRLTVLTDNHLFLFDLILRQKGEPKGFNIKPLPTSHTRSEKVAIEQIEHLYLGYASAIDKGIVSEALAHRIHHFLVYARAGKALTEAAAEAGVSMDLVRKLSSLGMT